MRRLAALTVVALLLVFSSAAISAAGGETVSGVEVDDSFYEEQKKTDKVEVVLRFGDIDLTGADAARLRSAAQQNRIAVEKLTKSTDGVRIKNNLWLANAVVVSVDRKKLPIERLASVDGVERLHANFEVRLQSRLKSPKSYADVNRSASNITLSSNLSDTQSSYTYGLQQINAPQTWSQFGTRGSGAKIAVLDTGVDPDHPDIDLYTEDPTDPTYPGGWAEFDEFGNPVGSEPYDSDTHGTHVSGTVAGGDASGTAIGVAPQAQLMHGLVLNGGVGSFAQIVGGMQWAVENDADVISMSLGSPGYDGDWIEPIRNVESQGVLVISSSGNRGQGTSGSPGNVYDSLSVGASNQDRDIAGFSSGESVDTDQDWTNPPADWPSEYVIPDVAAPGALVESALPGGRYGTKSGTSMAAPHVSGAAALMESASGDDLSPTEIRTALESTATKPNNWSEPEDERDTRYGYGIIDALDATNLVATQSGVKGTVTDTTGQPVQGVTVSVNGRTTTTDSSGSYQIIATQGSYDITANGFGYAPETASVTVSEGAYTNQDFVLDDALGAREVDGQPETAQVGSTIEMSFEVANLEEYTVGATGSFPVQEASLYIEGQQHSFGESVPFDSYDGSLTVEVVTQDTEALPATLGLNHQFTGAGTTESLSTGPTEVLEQYIRVGVVDDAGEYGEDTASALDSSLPQQYSIEVTESGSVDMDSYDVYVVQYVNPSNTGFVQETLGTSVPALYLDQWAGTSNGVHVLSDVTGDPGNVGSDYNSAPPVYHEIEGSHPILEYAELEPGDTVDIYNNGWGDHAWFSDTGFEVLATVGDQQKGVRGPALAVDEDDSLVLASSLGRTQYALNQDFTEQADEILAGSVEYLSGPGPSEPPTASFTYTPSSPEAGEPVSFDASDSFNPGGTVQSYDWSFGDGSTASGVQVTHEYGSTGDYTVSLTVTGSEGETDTVSQTLSVSSGSGGGSATVSSRDVTIPNVGDTGESAVTIDADNGVGIANVEVTVDTSVAEITDVQPGSDVDTSDPGVTFDILDESSDSVHVEYANIGAGTGQADGFELMQIEFVAQTGSGGTPISVSDNGVYNGNSQQYSDVTVSEGQLTVGALFSQPLPGFSSPPTNTGDIHPSLYEDVDGDGDGTSPSQAVILWGQMVQNPEEFDDLTQEQVDALDWSGDGQLAANDAVLLWGQQVQATG